MTRRVIEHVQVELFHGYLANICPEQRSEMQDPFSVSSHWIQGPRLLLNRIVLPREDIEPVVHEAHIMWTSTRNYMVAKHWIPNHVVPLIPTQLQPGTDDVDNVAEILSEFNLTEIMGHEDLPSLLNSSR